MKNKKIRIETKQRIAEMDIGHIQWSRNHRTLRRTSFRTETYKSILFNVFIIFHFIATTDKKWLSNTLPCCRTNDSEPRILGAFKFDAFIRLNNVWNSNGLENITLRRENWTSDKMSVRRVLYDVNMTMPKIRVAYRSSKRS